MKQLLLSRFLSLGVLIFINFPPHIEPQKSSRGNSWTSILDLLKASNSVESAEYLLNSIVPLEVLNFLKNETAQSLIFEELLPFAASTKQEVPKCFMDLQYVLRQLIKTVGNITQILDPDNSWTLQMVDSAGKFPEGILSGHVNAYGDWDECVGISVPGHFRGKSCWIYKIPAFLSLDLSHEISGKAATSFPELIRNMMNPLTTAIIPSSTYCVPSSCSQEEIQAVANAYATLVRGGSIIPYVSYCEMPLDGELDVGAITMIAVIALLVALSLIGTTTHLLLDWSEALQPHKNELWAQLLLAFSLPRNIRKWGSTSDGDGGGFGCIHGIRFLSTSWVILSHTVFILLLQGPLWNTIQVNNIYKQNWTFYVILNGYFSVDTFFTVSGLLACYTICRTLDKTGGKLNLLQLYLHRYIRLTPTYALIIGVLANLLLHLGSGPFFTLNVRAMQKNCRAYWWHNLLYFNNVAVYPEGMAMCEGESWYMANDMQFFILSPLFAFLLWKWRRVGMGVLGGATLASILAPGITVGTEGLPPTNIFWKNPDSPRLSDVYQHPWYRIGPYLAGMWMGYFLHSLKDKRRTRIKLGVVGVVGGWTLSTCTAAALLFGVIPNYDPNHEDGAVWSGIYGGLSRATWGLVICWVIFACSNGYGGWVNEFLSWKAFQPLGRLTFCVYLSSFSVQILYHFTLRQPMLFDTYHLVINTFFSHLVACFLVGFILSLIFESPFIVLEKILLRGGDLPKKVEEKKEDLKESASN